MFGCECGEWNCSSCRPHLEQLEKAEAYKLCWMCNKRFRGNKKYPMNIQSSGETIYVHKSCRNKPKGFGLSHDTQSDED